MCFLFEWRVMLLLLLLALSAVVQGRLEVIGAGMSRTGTSSLREALNILGYKTYHMMEIVEKSKFSDVQRWQSYFEGQEKIEEFADIVYADYTAAVDAPTCNAWKDLAEFYPHAKIVLTERASHQEWWESMVDTVLSPSVVFSLMHKVVPIFVEIEKMGKLLWHKELGWTPPRKATAKDREELVAFYKRRSEEIKIFDPERTLVFNVRQGWEPLCEFLGKPIPNEPFPKSNTRKEFHRIVLSLTLAAVVVPTVLLLSCVFGLRMLVVKRQDRTKKD